jgi:hypothetical protein
MIMHRVSGRCRPGKFCLFCWSNCSCRTCSAVRHVIVAGAQCCHACMIVVASNHSHGEAGCPQVASWPNLGSAMYTCRHCMLCLPHPLQESFLLLHSSNNVTTVPCGFMTITMLPIQAIATTIWAYGLQPMGKCLVKICRLSGLYNLLQHKADIAWSKPRFARCRPTGYMLVAWSACN